jgi:dipeptidyl aminopeptidase/acylaminoacyl peptidase
MLARFRAVPLALCLALPLAAETLPKHPFSVHDLLAMDRISDPRPSADGSLVAFTLRSTDLAANKGRTDIWLLDLKSRTPRRLTSNDAADTNARWAADGRSLLFLSTRGGSSQVYRLSLSGGEPEQVTDLPLDVDGMEVMPGGKGLLVSMAVFPGKSPEETKKLQDEKAKVKASGRLYDALFVRHWDTWADGTRNHLFVVPLGSGKATDARDLMKPMVADCPTKPFGGMEDAAVSPDGKTVVFSARDVGGRESEEAWSTNFDLFQAPADGSAAPKKITTNPAWDAQPLFSPDGKSLVYLAMSRAGYEADRFRIVVRDLATGKERAIDLRVDESKRGDRSPAEIAISPDGKTLYATADNVQQKSIFAVDLATGKTRVVVKDGTCGDVRPLPDGRLLYTMNSLLGPTEIYAVSAAGGPAEKLTHIDDDRMAQAKIGTPEQFIFTGAHGDEVWGYVVKPVDFDPAKKYPVAFLIHGGPQGSFGNDFHYRWNPQAYAGAGYAAVMVDFHGSTGYGQAFTDAINGDWGGAPFEDLMKGLDAALAKYPFLDKDRMAALGASYGGYMINWVAGHTDRFKALVCHDGNIDERMAYYDTEELWFPEWEHKGVPWENADGYTKHNPIDFVKNWKTPTLVIHGEKDFRVVYTQGISTFTALQRKGVPSRLLVFPDENHWVLKPQNSIQWHETVLGWLERWTRK